ncbi:hypothetical protein BDR26DRAFT_1010684 [Obelidium mucronatum]|nr:hypothetical protein BDR26DRAFT_1010684 [Obelidium mucronatum]
MKDVFAAVRILRDSNAAKENSDANWKTEYEKLLFLTNKLMDGHSAAINDSFHADVEKLETLEESLERHELETAKNQELNDRTNLLREATKHLEAHCKYLEFQLFKLDASYSNAMTHIDSLAETVDSFAHENTLFRQAFTRANAVSKRLGALDAFEPALLEKITNLKTQVIQLNLAVAASKVKSGQVEKLTEKVDDCEYMVNFLRDDNRALIETLDSLKRENLAVAAERDWFKKDAIEKALLLTQKTNLLEASSKTVSEITASVELVSQELNIPLNSIKKLQESLSLNTVSTDSSIHPPTIQTTSASHSPQDQEQKPHQFNNQRINQFFTRFKPSMSTASRTPSQSTEETVKANILVHQQYSKTASSTSIVAPTTLSPALGDPSYPTAGIAMLPGESRIPSRVVHESECFELDHRKSIESPSHSGGSCRSNDEHQNETTTGPPPTIRRERRDSLYQNYYVVPDRHQIQGNSDGEGAVFDSIKERAMTADQDGQSFYSALSTSKHNSLIEDEKLKPSLKRAELVDLEDALDHQNSECDVNGEEFARSVTPKASFQIGDLTLQKDGIIMNFAHKATGYSLMGLTAFLAVDFAVRAFRTTSRAAALKQEKIQSQPTSAEESK